MNVDYVAMGDNIRKYRHLSNMYQADLAEKCDCSISHIGQIERARTTPSLEMIVKIANALSVTVDQLLCDSYDKPEAVYLVDIAKRIDKFSVSKRIIICESINNYIESFERIEKTR